MIEIRRKIARKSKFWGKLGVKLKIFTTKDQSVKGAELSKKLIEIGGDIEKIESLMVN